MLSSGILFFKVYRIGLKMQGLSGRMLQESVAESYKNHRPNVARINGRELQELLPECYKNYRPNLARIRMIPLLWRICWDWGLGHVKKAYCRWNHPSKARG
jgi:hypothetical protein